MKQLKTLLLLPTFFLLSCASTNPRQETADQTLNQNRATSATADFPKVDECKECNSLLDDCAEVVKKDQIAISEQQKTIQIMGEQVANEKQNVQDEQKSTALYKGAAFGEAAVIVLLKLLGLLAL